MSNNPELDARCAYALYQILGKSHQEHRRVGLAGAESCGYEAFPSKQVSAFFQNEPELLAAYQHGWNRAHEENQPRSAAELKEIIDRMDKDSYAGCGQFYELYAQRFTSTIDGWIPSLRDGELEIVLSLLKTTAYESDPGGYWTYDQEEGDIYFVSYTE